MDIDNELKAIQELHERDMRATRAGDFRTLRSIMSDEAVVMPPGGLFQQGKPTLDRNFERMSQSENPYEVTDYVMDFAEVQVVGDYAFEYGTIRGTMRHKELGVEERSAYKVMRVLRKEAGAWKVYRTIWNDMPLE